VRSIVFVNTGTRRSSAVRAHAAITDAEATWSMRYAVEEDATPLDADEDTDAQSDAGTVTEDTEKRAHKRGRTAARAAEERGRMGMEPKQLRKQGVGVKTRAVTPDGVAHDATEKDATGTDRRSSRPPPLRTSKPRGTVREPAAADDETRAPPIPRGGSRRGRGDGKPVTASECRALEQPDLMRCMPRRRPPTRSAPVPYLAPHLHDFWLSLRPPFLPLPTPSPLP